MAWRATVMTVSKWVPTGSNGRICLLICVEKSNAMKRVQVTLESDGSLIRSDKQERGSLKGRIDSARIDARIDGTTEAEIARQAAI